MVQVKQSARCVWACPENFRMKKTFHHYIIILHLCVLILNIVWISIESQCSMSQGENSSSSNGRQLRSFCSFYFFLIFFIDFGRRVVVDEWSEVSLSTSQWTLSWQLILWTKSSPNPREYGSRAIRHNGSVRQKVQLTGWVQANQLTDAMDADKPVNWPICSY